jgi:hypothetical protein
LSLSSLAELSWKADEAAVDGRVMGVEGTVAVLAAI